MNERSRFFDDLAGVAGGALSALSGLRDEAESTMRARAEEVIRKLDLVRREDLEAVQELAANARAAQTALEARVAALEAKLEATRPSAPPEIVLASADSAPVDMTPPVEAATPRPETPDVSAPKSA